MWPRVPHRGTVGPSKVIAIRSALAIAPMSKKALVKMLRARSHDVRCTVNRMAEAGELVADGRLWRLSPGR